MVYLVTLGTSMLPSYSSIRLWAQPSPNGIQPPSVLKGYRSCPTPLGLTLPTAPLQLCLLGQITEPGQVPLGWGPV